MHGIEKIESNLNETWLKATDWIDPVQSRDWWYAFFNVVHSCGNNNEPSVSISCREFLN